MEEEKGGRTEMERRGGRGAQRNLREERKENKPYLDISKKGLVTILHIFILTLQVYTHTKS